MVLPVRPPLALEARLGKKLLARLSLSCTERAISCPTAAGSPQPLAPSAALIEAGGGSPRRAAHCPGAERNLINNWGDALALLSRSASDDAADGRSAPPPPATTRPGGCGGAPASSGEYQLQAPSYGGAHHAGCAGQCEPNAAEPSTVAFTSDSGGAMPPDSSMPTEAEPHPRFGSPAMPVLRSPASRPQSALKSPVLMLPPPALSHLSPSHHEWRPHPSALPPSQPSSLLPPRDLRCYAAAPAPSCDDGRAASLATDAAAREALEGAARLRALHRGRAQQVGGQGQGHAASLCAQPHPQASDDNTRAGGHCGGGCAPHLVAAVDKDPPSPREGNCRPAQAAAAIAAATSAWAKRNPQAAAVTVGASPQQGWPAMVARPLPIPFAELVREPPAALLARRSRALSVSGYLQLAAELVTCAVQPPSQARNALLSALVAALDAQAAVGDAAMM
jgi:hypothetical protein